MWVAVRDYPLLTTNHTLLETEYSVLYIDYWQA